jgi:hypothetical protein
MIMNVLRYAYAAIFGIFLILSVYNLSIVLQPSFFVSNTKTPGIVGFVETTIPVRMIPFSARGRTYLFLNLNSQL